MLFVKFSQQLTDILKEALHNFIERKELISILIQTELITNNASRYAQSVYEKPTGSQSLCNHCHVIYICVCYSITKFQFGIASPGGVCINLVKGKNGDKRKHAFKF